MTIISDLTIARRSLLVALAIVASVATPHPVRSQLAVASGVTMAFPLDEKALFKYGDTTATVDVTWGLGYTASLEFRAVAVPRGESTPYRFTVGMGLSVIRLRGEAPAQFECSRTLNVGRESMTTIVALGPQIDLGGGTELYVGAGSRISLALVHSLSQVDCSKRLPLIQSKRPQMYMAAFADGSLSWGATRMRLAVSARLTYEAHVAQGEITIPHGPYMALANATILIFEPAVSLQYNF